VRALFEAGRIADAERTASLFTRDTEKQGAGLKEMQHMWCVCAACLHMSAQCPEWTPKHTILAGCDGVLVRRELCRSC
jgi:hypothetical protein